MPALQLGSIDLRSENDIYLVASFLKRLTAPLKMDNLAETLVLVSSSELAWNVIKHAQKGVCKISFVPEKEALELLFIDSGPGIGDIDKALKDGYSTMEGSLGIGLGAVSRAVDKMEFLKSDESGTEIRITKYLHESKALDIYKITENAGE